MLPPVMHTRNQGLAIMKARWEQEKAKQSS